MEKNPLVTIMMPTRNRSNFIIGAIGSVLHQSYDNWELVVFDDCSTDITTELVKTLAEFDNRIKYYKTSKRLGLPKSRNKILALARGELIGHLDDDDILHENAIKKMVSEFNKNPKLALVYSDFIMIDEKNNKIKEDMSFDFDRNKLAYLGFRHFTMYKKSIALEIGGFNENVWCEDGDLFMRIAIKYECKRVPEFLYFYRYHKTNFGRKRPACKDCNKTHKCDYFKIWTKEYRKFMAKQKSISTP